MNQIKESIQDLARKMDQRVGKLEKKIFGEEKEEEIESKRKGNGEDWEW